MVQQFDLSLIIACYCEERHLYLNTMYLVKLLNNTRLSYELIFVEDKSPDQTRKELERCCSKLKELSVFHQVILHSRNKGRGASVTDGFGVAHGRIVGFIDIDLEHMPDAILPIVVKLSENCPTTPDGIVFRRIEDAFLTSITRLILGHGYRFLVHLLLDLPVSDSEAGLKFFLRDKILPILPHVQDQGWFWDTEIVHQAFLHGLKIEDHYGAFIKNKSKKSTVRLFHDSINYFVKLINYKRRLKKNRLTVRKHVQNSI